MKRVYIVRGPSGCGKRRWIKSKITPEQKCLIVSMDQHRYEGGGVDREYVYDPKKNGEIAATCRLQFASGLLDAETDVIYVDNTHITRWQWLDYAAVARVAGARVSVIDFTTDSFEVAKELAARNTHGVPLHTIYDQISRFESAEGETDYVDDYTRYVLEYDGCGGVHQTIQTQITLEMVNTLADYQEAITAHGRDSAKTKLREAHKKAMKKLGENYDSLSRKITVFDADNPEHVEQLRGNVVLLQQQSFELPVPQDHTKDYDVAIQMADWEVGDNVELKQSDLQCFIMDDWEWKGDFERVSNFYKNS